MSWNLGNNPVRLSESCLTLVIPNTDLKLNSDPILEKIRNMATQSYIHQPISNSLLNKDLIGLIHFSIKPSLQLCLNPTHSDYVYI